MPLPALPGRGAGGGGRQPGSHAAVRRSHCNSPKLDLNKAVQALIVEELGSTELCSLTAEASARYG